MPGEDEARVGLSAQLATTALTTTTTTTSSSAGGSGTSQSSLASSAGVAGASSSSSSSVTAATTGGGGTAATSLLSSTSSSGVVGGVSAGLPKVPLPALAAHSYGSSRGLGLGSGLLSGGGGSLGLSSSNNTNSGGYPTATTTLTPIAIGSYNSPSNNTVTTVNNNFTPGATTTTITTNNTTGAGILSNINNPGVTTVDGLNNRKQQQQQSFQSNPLGGGAAGAGARVGPLLANLNQQNSGSGGLVNSYNKQHQYPLHQYQQQQPQPQLSLKPIIATPNGNPSSAPVAETNKRDTGTHGRHPGGGGSGHHGRGAIDDDEIDDAGDSSKLELQLQFAGIDNETAVDVDVDDEENNYEAGIESGPMCTVVPTSNRSGNGGGGGSSSNGGGGEGGDKSGGGHPSSSFPGGSGDVPGGGSGTMVVASSAAAAGSAAPATSTTSSTTLGGGGAGGAGGAETGPTNSLAAAGTTTGAAGRGGSMLGDDEDDDDEEDVEGGKTVECTEVVVPIQTFAEKCLFYTTAFFILLAVFSLFAFLFLVPFVIDPAFTTIFMEFDPEPAFCQTVSFEQKEGLSNCTWTSCREGCTREVYQCKQIRVNYRSARRSRSSEKADFQQEQLPQPQQLRRPNNNKNNNNIHSNNHNNLIHTFIDNNYHGGSSSLQLASDLRRSSEHSGSSFNTPFNNNNNNNYNNLINDNYVGGSGGGGGGGIANTYHNSASSTGSGGGSLRDASSKQLSRSSTHYKNLLMNALHRSSKYNAVHSSSAGGGERDLTASSLISHMNSASAVSYGGGIGGGVAMSLKAGKHNRMASQHLKSASVQQGSNNGVNGAEPFWDYTGAHLFPNVKGCGYPPVVVCSDFVEKFGKEGTNFSCYYSKVDRALVVTQYDMSRVIMDLIYSMAIPIPSFIISVVYLIFAYFRIYNTDASSSNETGGGGRAERLNSSSTTTNLQNPGSANRGGGGSDDPDAETSLSVDDKTCIIHRSTSGGLNALSNKLPNSGKGLHAQVIEMNDLNPQRHPVDGDVFLPQKRNNNCSNNPANPERNGPTNPAAKNKGEETSATPAVEAS